jgi:hypothetical protein
MTVCVCMYVCVCVCVCMCVYVCVCVCVCSFDAVSLAKWFRVRPRGASASGPVRCAHGPCIHMSDVLHE